MLSQLRQIVQQFNKDPDLSHGLNTLVNTTRAAINADCCSLFLCADEVQHMQLMALSKGFDFKAKHTGLVISVLSNTQYSATTSSLLATIAAMRKMVLLKLLDLMPL